MRHLTHYETPESQRGQNRVKDEVCKAYRLLAEPNPWGRGVNTMFLNLDHVPQFVADIRVRNNQHDTYPTIMIGVPDGWRPVMAMMDWLDEQELAGFPVLYLHGFTDGVYFCRISREMKRFIRYNDGGRTDRDDPADYGACVYIPKGLFKPLAMLGSVVLGRKS